jgi:hypothetical protein
MGKMMMAAMLFMLGTASTVRAQEGPDAYWPVQASGDWDCGVRGFTIRRTSQGINNHDLKVVVARPPLALPAHVAGGLLVYLLSVTPDAKHAGRKRTCFSVCNCDGREHDQYRALECSAFHAIDPFLIHSSQSRYLA